MQTIKGNKSNIRRKIKCLKKIGQTKKRVISLVKDAISAMDFDVEDGRCVFSVRVTEFENIGIGKKDNGSSVPVAFTVSIESPSLAWLMQNRKDKVSRAYWGEGMNWIDKMYDYKDGEDYKNDAESLYKVLMESLEANDIL